MKRKYEVNILYDNGISEGYRTDELTNEELDDLINVPYQAFLSGKDANAVLQLKSIDGFHSIIDVKKIVRVSVNK